MSVEMKSLQDRAQRKADLEEEINYVVYRPSVHDFKVTQYKKPSDLVLYTAHPESAQ